MQSRRFPAWLLRTRRSYGGTGSVWVMPHRSAMLILVRPSRCEWLRYYLRSPISAATFALQPLRNGDGWRRRPSGRRCIRGWWADSYRRVQHQRSPSISTPAPTHAHPASPADIWHMQQLIYYWKWIEHSTKKKKISRTVSRALLHTQGLQKRHWAGSQVPLMYYCKT